MNPEEKDVSLDDDEVDRLIGRKAELSSEIARLKAESVGIVSKLVDSGVEFGRVPACW